MESIVNNNSTNYITYYLGNPEDILRSTRIKLFYRKDLTLTLSNIFEVHDTIVESPEYNESGFYNFITRESSDECFEIIPEKINDGIFSSIIYYTSSSSLPVGFTNFFRTQSLVINEKAKIDSIKLYTSFKINHLNQLSNNKTLIINSLADLRTFMNSDTEISSRLLKNYDQKDSFSTTSAVLDYYNKTSNCGVNYKRYTSSLTDLLFDPSLILVTDCISLCGGQTPTKYKFSLSNGIELNTYDVTYTKFFIGKYNNEISLFEWSDNDETWGTFRVISLTRKNRFGLPKVLVEKTVINAEDLPKGLDIKTLDVEIMSEDYIVFVDKIKNEQYLYNMTTKSPLSKISPDYGIVVDWETGDVEYYLKNKDISSILEIFPKESRLYKEFISLPIHRELYSSLFFEKKVGNWYVFKTTGTNSSGREVLIYSSRFGLIYFDESERNNIIPVNDKTLLVQTKLDSGEYLFSFYFIKLGLPVYSNKYSEINGLGIEINNKIEFTSKNSSLSDEDLIRKKLLIDGLRRAPIKSYEFSESMKFVSSYFGILFYIEEVDGVQKIFYL